MGTELAATARQPPPPSNDGTLRFGRMLRDVRSEADEADEAEAVAVLADLGVVASQGAGSAAEAS